MTSTDNLIHSLASTAGTRRSSASLQAALAVTGAASLACALLLVFSVIGIRQDFADMAVRMPFAFKVVCTGALVFGASVRGALCGDARRICDRAIRYIASGHSPGFGRHIRSNRYSDHGEDQHCRCLLRGPHSFSFVAGDGPDLRLHAERRADAASLRGSSHWNTFRISRRYGLYARLQE